MRNYPEPLAAGQEIRDGVNGTYRVDRVMTPIAAGGLGMAWAVSASTAAEGASHRRGA